MGMEFPAELRNIGIIAHIDAGKTTLTERILHRTGEIRYCGEVQEGTTVTDWLQQERERGISIMSAAVSCHWRRVRINVVDTPGHVDFTAEVERSLRVLDGVVAVFCGVRGVQAQSETVWRRAERHSIPTIAFVNKLDREGADFGRCVREIEQRFHVTALPLQIPWKADGAFRGMIDILTGKGIGMTHANLDFSDEIEVLEARERLTESLAEVNDDVLSAYLAGAEPSIKLLKRTLRQAVLERKVIPVLGGSAWADIGVDSLLDAVCDYLPSPSESAEESRRKSGMLVFKVCPQEEYGEELACVRMYGGSLEANAPVWNSRTGEKLTVSRIYRMHASLLEETDSVESGDLAALGGMAGHVMTGDTLSCSERRDVFEKIDFPEPVVSVVLEGRGKTDSRQLGMALRAFCLEDPTLRMHSGPGLGQWTLSGMGELHLSVVEERLKSDFGVELSAGQPKVSFRRTVKGNGEGRCDFVKQLPDGRTLEATVELSVESRTVGSGMEMDFSPAHCLSEEQTREVRNGLNELVSSGLGDGYPLSDFRIHVERISGSGQFSELAFQVAAQRALKEALTSAETQILEPIMKLEVTAPHEQIGNLIADLMSRRGHVTEMESQPAGMTKVLALVPLSEMFGYASALRSLSGGRGDFVAEPSIYAPL